MWGKEIPTLESLPMPLTIKEIENAKPREKKYKLAESGGLCLVVQPWGGKFWLWRYRFDGAEKNMTFGDYPHVGPKDARDLHFAAKKLLATGTNPMSERKAEADYPALLNEIPGYWPTYEDRSKIVRENRCGPYLNARCISLAH